MITLVEPGPACWLDNAQTLLRIVDAITPGVVSKILQRFVDVSVLLSLEDEAWDPRALSDALRFAGVGVA